ncbi:uncharacterized protein LOC110440417 isoform X3 [Mizuhopecten yessoensis]|uniref:Uncharacterized protein n=1 Tax=Mizuhopecten yessoensis TaxID=6573 RepID=A0A210PL59_MIZYE|nr:uncharacterized protein LOC110440417 isoform X3 [Mizuhopecten yessoensis]OWF37222.1 hypothetical protein KP79_PYT12385 [Mizuhopecten yessoensis]
MRDVRPSVSVTEGKVLDTPVTFADIPRLNGPGAGGRVSIIDGRLSAMENAANMRPGILSRDNKSRLSTHTRDVKSRASSDGRHREKDAGYFRQGRTDLSSASRELLRKRLFTTAEHMRKGQRVHRGQVTDISFDDIPGVSSEKGTGELGQLFTVLRPCPEIIKTWPDDVLSKRFYTSHDQRHAIPKSLWRPGKSPRGQSDVMSRSGYSEITGRTGETVTSATSCRAVTSATSSVSDYLTEKRMPELLEEFYTDKKYLDKFVE